MQALLIRWGILAAVAVAFYAFAWYRGDMHGTQKLLDYQGQQATEAVRIAKGRDTVTERAVTQYVKVKGATVVVTEKIEKEVLVYANAGNCLDAEWRRLHDRAAANAVSNAGFKSDGEGGAPSAVTAISTVTANYAGCHRTADRLDSLQAWVREQQAVR